MNVCVGIPILDSVPGECFPWLVRQCCEIVKLGHTIVLETPMNMLPHDRPRHAILTTALDFKCDLLYFLDDDMRIPAGAFSALHKALIEHKAAVVSGRYCRRGYPFTSVWSLEIDDPSGQKKWVQVDDRDKNSQAVSMIHCSGLGCALIDLAWVRDHLKPPYFSMEHNGLTSVVSDDTSFFGRVKAAGGLVLGHGGVRCGHACSRIFADDDTENYLRALDLTLQARESLVLNETRAVLEEKGK